MQTKTNRFDRDLTLKYQNTTRFDYLEVPKKLLGYWIWRSDPSEPSDRRLVLRWRSGVENEQRAIVELSRMTPHELADIGLSRSDLTIEGLAIAGAKRARKQGLNSAELAELANKKRASEHGS